MNINVAIYSSLLRNNTSPCIVMGGAEAVGGIGRKISTAVGVYFGVIMPSKRGQHSANSFVVAACSHTV